MENKLVEEVEKTEPMIPGIGIAGKVICPILSISGRDVECQKHKCEWWVELNANGIQVGRCALPWSVVVLTELRASIDKLNTQGEKKETETVKE